VKDVCLPAAVDDDDVQLFIKAQSISQQVSVNINADRIGTADESAVPILCTINGSRYRVMS